MSHGMLLAATTSRTYFEWGRVHANSDWIAPILALVATAAYVVWLYRRDAAELGPAVRTLLVGLRLAAIVGVLWIYLQPQWRTEHDVTTNSQAVLLVDTSLSMGLADESFPSSAGAPNRAQRVMQALKGEKLLSELRKTHDVTVARFDTSTSDIVVLPKLSATSTSAEKPSPDAETTRAVDWATALAPRGAETRLGQGLREALIAQRGGPISGVVLFTDGGQNSGPGPKQALEIAQQLDARIHAVGLGSDRQPINLRIADLTAPARAYPGDSYTVTVFVQAQGMAGRAVRLELLTSASATDDRAAEAGVIEAASEVRLGADGETVPVRFDLTPTEPGRRALTARVVAPADDSNPNDNQQQAEVEVVDEKTRVLLFASGPTREYRFLHTLLFRDDHVEVDVLLGTAQEGISQEARRILDAFPATREELDEYDCIVAFDPDWQSLPAATIDALEHWVADQAGGLVLVAGPVHSDTWVEKPGLTKIRDLYPVEFRRRFALSETSTPTASDAWPLEFTREGLEADFLWLGDSAGASREAWTGFGGVYQCLEVRGPKPGATIYARFAEPNTEPDGGRPYFCGQFYGAGRVFYLGSGEMWRLRSLDPAHFEQFYTKLVRHVSQGRLMRGSSRGVLLADRERYFLGQTVEVRAQLTTPQLEPLEAASVSLAVARPDGTTENVELSADGVRVGNFSGQFVVSQEGAYELELPLPGGGEQSLTRRIQSRVPDLERENPSRNDALLTEITKTGGGRYYIGVEDALGMRQSPAVWTELPDRSLVRPQSEKPRSLWDNWQVMTAIAGCLCLEWLVRRFAKLA
jgi:hypothetical protein